MGKRSPGGWRRAAWAAIVVGCAGGALPAQDVIVNPPAWLVERDAPDVLPTLKSSKRISFPEELKTTPDIGYVVVHLILDAKGKVQMIHPRGTLAAYSRVGLSDPSVWTPGLRDGKGVNTATTFSVIFNPATAAEKHPDATPRLLEVSLVTVAAPKRKKPSAPIPDRLEWAEVSVDEHGRVTAVKKAPPELERDFTIAVKNWRFAPARQGGKPVAADVRMPFVVMTRGADELALAGKRQQPRAIDQTPPVYPLAMRENGMKGEVIVDFFVDIEGRVRNAFVIRSLNQSFDDPALEAVRSWRFEPGRVGERLVNTHMQVPIMFALDDTADGGRGPLSAAPRKADLSKLPEQFRYDTPPRPVGTVRPVYPYALLRAKKEGKAVVRFIVDSQGRVIETVIGESAAPELGRAFRAAIECFAFEPAIKAGRPSPALLGLTQQFTREAAWQMVNDEDLALLRREENKPETIVMPDELDAKLTVVSQRPPRFPLSVGPEVTKGKALVEVLVDEDGKVRLPRVVSASDDAFGYAAVQGAAAWRYEPPTRGGRPVVVRVQIPFNFKQTTAAPAKP